jgi:putative tryptophan/tyrosine transport system substrate-binding protein
MISRRRVLLLLAVAPASAWAQPAPGTHKIGVLSAGHNPKAKDHPNFPAFFAGMRKLGYEEGRNLTYEVRNADGANARLPQLVREIIASGVQMIVVTGSTEASAAFKATATLPIVMIHATDPVEFGFAVSLARPGRNLTGQIATTEGFSAKALTLLMEAIPRTKRIAVLGNPDHVSYAGFRKETEAVAAKKGVSILPTAVARKPEELDAAFARISQDAPDAFLVQSDALFFVHRKRIITFAAQQKLPVMYRFTEDVEAGGLMAFATRYRDLYERAPIFVDKILKGAKPGDIPIEQPTRFGLWINQKTARELGIKFPPAVLARAERVIE